MATPNKQWALQQSLPSSINPDCLLRLQSRPIDSLVNIKCGDYTLRSSKEFSVRFEIQPSPQCSYFFLELTLTPPLATKASNESLHANSAERMAVRFCTYDPAGKNKYADRKPYKYTSNMGNTPPAGELNFSQQLNAVMYRTADELTSLGLPTHEEVELAKQSCWCWRSLTCVKFEFSRPTAHLSPAAQSAATTFRKMIAQLTEKRDYITVVTKNRPLLASVWWPYFCSVPAPVPETWFGWVFPPNTEPTPEGEEEPGLMRFPPNKPFERDLDYVNCALAIREKKGWYKDDKDGVEDASKYPKDPKLAIIDKAVRFTDEREYLAHILGGFAYEEMHGKSTLDNWVNGDHTCDVFSDDTPGSRKAVILLNVRPPRDQDREHDSAHALPEEHDRVDINLEMNKVYQTWRGSVIRIPHKYLKYGRNVAILAERPPSLTGIVDSTFQIKGQFHFGHYGSPTAPAIERILEVFGGKDQSALAVWWKNLLLAQDLYELDGNKQDFTASMPKGFKKKVDEVCNERRLNEKQSELVRHYFTHRVTLGRGGPGAGKSTLIDAVLELEEHFNNDFWMCADSNAAVDVVVRKVCSRKGSLNPPGLFRIKPAFEEKLVVEGPDMSIKAVPSIPQSDGPETPAQAIARFLRSSENVARAMSLEATIKKRYTILEAMEKNPKLEMFEGEHAMLVELKAEYGSVFGYKIEADKSDVEILMEQQRFERKYLSCLRRIQQGLVQRAKGIFSTAAAAGGPLLRKHAPRALIMDEASQFMEARAVFPILRAVKCGKLQRVLLIGDDLQLPPTLMAPRNPFHATGMMSLFERLVKAGFPVIILQVQHRMEPSISSILRKTIYPYMEDGPSTSTQPGVTEFRTYMQQFASQLNVTVGQTNAFVISPVRHSKLHWGSQKAAGSQSRFTMLNARMVFRKAYLLVKHGKFAPSDIKIVSFYCDQVTVLTALFADMDMFKGVVIETADGSQGGEAKVVIVDCVAYGAESDDGMGFLNEDRRRFNVAMSRAKVGRIVIAHKRMVGVKMVKGQPKNIAGIWNDFFEEAREAKAVMDGGYLNEAFESRTMAERFDDVSATWDKRAVKQRVGHRNVEQGKTDKTATVSQSKRPHKDHDMTAFVEATGGTDNAAKQYLTEAKGDLHIAIDKYLTSHGGIDVEVEEVPRKE